MLFDKLTIVKLKQYHTEDSDRLNSLSKHAAQLQLEIDEYVNDSVREKLRLNEWLLMSIRYLKKSVIRLRK